MRMMGRSIFLLLPLLVSFDADAECNKYYSGNPITPCESCLNHGGSQAWRGTATACLQCWFQCRYETLSTPPERQDGEGCSTDNVLLSDAIGGVIRIEREDFEELAKLYPALAEMLTLMIDQPTERTGAVDLRSIRSVLSGPVSAERALKSWNGNDPDYAAEFIDPQSGILHEILGTGRTLDDDAREVSINFDIVTFDGKHRISEETVRVLLIRTDDIFDISHEVQPVPVYRFHSFETVLR